MSAPRTSIKRWNTGQTTAIVRLLPTGLLLIFLGLVIFALVDLDREPWTFIVIVLCLGGRRCLGGGYALAAL